MAVAKKALRRAEHLRNAGDAAASLSVLRYVGSMFDDYGYEMPASYFKPRTDHQKALSLAELGNHKEAKKAFRRSIDGFVPDNFIGRGRATRDYGMWMYTQGRTDKALRTLVFARDLFMKDRGSCGRRERELIVTDGFIARIRYRDDPEGALEEFRRVDKEIRGGEKWIYELDNLRHMIPLSPLLSQLSYRARAKTIECRMDFHENFQVLIEDIRYGKRAKALMDFGTRELHSLSPF